MEFTTTQRKKVDLIQHIYETKATHKNLKIHVGTDGASKNGTWYYFLVVSFRYGRNGAHFIYQKQKMKALKIEKNGRKFPDLFTKLWKEAEITMACAQYLRNNGIEVDAVEMDYNTSPRWYSNRLINATQGWAIGEGYKVLNKSCELIAVKAADHLCQHGI